MSGSAPEGAGARIPPTQGTGQGLGTTPSPSHGPWAWGRGSFGSRLIQGSCCTTFLLPRSSCRDSRLLQLPDLAHTGGPGAPARPCPSRDIGHPRMLSRARRAGWKGKEGQGRAGQVVLLCRDPGSWWPMLCPLFVRPSRWSECRGFRDLAHCVNTVTTGEMFSLRWHLPKFSCS